MMNIVKGAHAPMEDSMARGVPPSRRASGAEEASDIEPRTSSAKRSRKGGGWVKPALFGILLLVTAAAVAWLALSPSETATTSTPALSTLASIPKVPPSQAETPKVEKTDTTPTTPPPEEKWTTVGEDGTIEMVKEGDTPPPPPPTTSRPCSECTKIEVWCNPRLSKARFIKSSDPVEHRRVEAELLATCPQPPARPRVTYVPPPKKVVVADEPPACKDAIMAHVWEFSQHVPEVKACITRAHQIEASTGVWDKTKADVSVARNCGAAMRSNWAAHTRRPSSARFVVRDTREQFAHAPFVNGVVVVPVPPHVKGKEILVYWEIPGGFNPPRLMSRLMVGRDYGGCSHTHAVVQ